MLSVPAHRYASAPSLPRAASPRCRPARRGVAGAAPRSRKRDASVGAPVDCAYVGSGRVAAGVGSSGEEPNEAVQGSTNLGSRRFERSLHSGWRDFGSIPGARLSRACPRARSGAASRPRRGRGYSSPVMRRMGIRFQRPPPARRLHVQPGPGDPAVVDAAHEYADHVQLRPGDRVPCQCHSLHTVSPSATERSSSERKSGTPSKVADQLLRTCSRPRNARSGCAGCSLV